MTTSADSTRDLLGSSDLPDSEVEVRTAGSSEGRTEEGDGSLDLPSSDLGACPEDEPVSTRDLLMHALAEAESESAAVAPAPRRGADLPTSAYSFLPEADDQAERRRAARFPLALQVTLIGLDKKRETVMATSGSIDAFFIRSPRPLEMDTPLTVQLEMLGNHGRRFPAVVVRTAPHGFAFQLEPDKTTTAFRAAFLELAQQPSLQAPKITVEVRPRKADEEAEAATEDSRGALAEAWRKVSEDPEDEDVNQTFIHECMRARDLEYAVARYRERVAEGDDTAQRYLEQVGTILGFYTMAPKDDIPLEADGFVKGRTRGWVALILSLVVAVGVAQWVLKDQPPKPSNPEDQQKGRGAGLITTEWKWGG